MRVDCFLDTNILVYAAAGRHGEEAKRKQALKLIETQSFGLSAQVLQQFYVTVVHKIEVPLTAAEALDWIEQFEAFPCLATDVNLVKIAAEVSQRHHISYWDGAIVAAAQVMEAHTLYSEDLSDGQQYGPVKVVNPFRPSRPS